MMASTSRSLFCFRPLKNYYLQSGWTCQIYTHICCIELRKLLAPENCSYRRLSYSTEMDGRKHKESVEFNKKLKAVDPVWRPVSRYSTQASSNEEFSAMEVPDMLEADAQVKELCITKISSAQGDIEVAAEKLTSASQVNEEHKFSGGKYTISVEVGASLLRFIIGKGGSTQKMIEDETGVKIRIPFSREEDSITIEGLSSESVSRAAEKIQAITDEAVKSPILDYSHFISLPLAINPELVDKLVSFQNSILGISHSSIGENLDSTSNKESSENENEDQKLKKGPNIAVKFRAEGGSEQVNMTNVPHVSYAPKSSKSSALSDLGIEKSIFIKPKTFHLTVLMLKLWNKDRVKAATDVLQSISSEVMEALDNRPLSIRLKGLDCMRGSLAKAAVLYAPVEEIGSEGRLLHACQVIIDAFVKAGLVLEKDTNQRLKLHATVMNARHRNRTNKTRKFSTFDARGIFEQYGSEEWGEYLIREVHLSQRFVFDDNGYYHCCASIPFPE